MTDLSALERRLANHDIIILDGAIGTELERLGAPMHEQAWCAAAMDTHPDLVRQVHRSYIEAGADIITANTYASTRHALEMAGLAHKFTEWNRRAVQIAEEVREEAHAARPVYIAGSVSTFAQHLRTERTSLLANFRAQGEILAASGVDLILLETLGSAASTIIEAIEATRGLGLPVWVAVSCAQIRETGELALGVEESQAHSDHRRFHEPFADAIDEIMAQGGSALLMMHSDLKVTRPALEVMRHHYRGPLGAYPNAGYWLRPQWAFVDQISPESYLAEAKGWVAAGAQIVGGCCGIGPEHIRALRAGL